MKKVLKAIFARYKHRKGHAAQLIRGGIGTVFIKVCGTIISLALVIFLARSLGPEGYGVYAYVIALASLLGIPSQLGLPSLVLRETANAHVRKQWALMRGIWEWSSKAVVLFSLVIIIISFAISWSLSSYLPSEYITTFWWGIVLIPCIALGALRGAALRGLKKVLQGQLPEQIIKPASLLLLLFLMTLYSGDTSLSPESAILLHLASAIFAFIFGAVLLWRACPDEVRKTSSSEYESEKWIASSISLALLAGMQVFNKYADILLIGIFESAADVGIYRVAVQGAMLVAFGVQVANMVVTPYFSHFYIQGKKESLQRLVTIVSRLTFLFTVPIVVLFVLFGKNLLAFAFGSEYTGGHTALSILAVGRLVISVFGPVSFLLIVTGYEKETARASAVGVCINIVLNLMLIPMLGIEGAAAATAISLMVWHYVLWRIAKKRVAIQTFAFGSSDL